MNLDKHDLFRNAVPGFVFFAVIFTYYFISGNTNNLAGEKALLLFMAGFPLGMIIHALYRPIFHIWRGEQNGMENEECENDALMRDNITMPGRTKSIYSTPANSPMRLPTTMPKIKIYKSALIHGETSVCTQTRRNRSTSRHSRVCRPMRFIPSSSTPNISAPMFSRCR